MSADSYPTIDELKARYPAAAWLVEFHEKPLNRMIVWAIVYSIKSQNPTLSADRVIDSFERNARMTAAILRGTPTPNNIAGHLEEYRTPDFKAYVEWKLSQRG